ncbi:MAG TPA: hypothetical protein VIF02_15930 [Methylocella sp.]|jgi:hypothetical protein
MITKLNKTRTAILANALGIALSWLILVAPPWGCSNALSAENSAPSEATASRIQAKISQVGAAATKLHESGGDVSPVQDGMQQVDKLLKNGNFEDAEKILDTLLTKLGLPAAGSAGSVAAPEAVAPAGGRDCDPRQPMTVNGPVTLSEDCTIGGDLTVTGNAVLHFDYTRHKGGRLVVSGNIIVRDGATLWIEGRPEERAVFAVDNEFSQQHSITSKDDATIKLDYVEFRSQKSPDRGKGSVYMSYNAKGRSTFEATGSALVEEEAWLLANLNDSAKLTIADTTRVPTEIYIHDSSSAKISGTGTRTGLWLDAGGAKGTLKLPHINAPFSWRTGAGAGLEVGWSLQVDNAQPGIGIEVKPASALTIIGNGAQAAVTGELKISYFVIGSRETLDGLKAGLQNRQISDRLTLKDVQLGPIAWQIYVGDNADLTIENSTINELGIFGRNAKVRVERSVLQLAVLAALGPGSSLDIRDSDVWNQTIEVANKGKVSIVGSRIHGTLFHTRDSGSNISIEGGSFEENPARCTQATMVNIATGQPKCNPFRPPGMPRAEGAGKVECAGTEGCTWGR